MARLASQTRGRVREYAAPTTALSQEMLAAPLLSVALLTLLALLGPLTPLTPLTLLAPLTLLGLLVHGQHHRQVWIRTNAWRVPVTPVLV